MKGRTNYTFLAITMFVIATLFLYLPFYAYSHSNSRDFDHFEYAFEDKFIIINGVTIHYIDEGQGPVLWLMHGNPTWSYLYRKMIPLLTQAGYRCIVPDLMGFGLSEKPIREEEYSLQRHVQLMTGLIERLGLKNIVTVGQDWGGPITLRYAIEHQSNIRGLVILNTSIERFPANFREKITQNRIFDPLPSIFRFFFKNAEFSSTQIRQLDAFRQFVWDGWVSGNQSDFGAGFRHPVDQKVMRNYLFPNDNWASRAGVANFVKSISDSAEDSNAAYLDEIRDVLKNWNIPMLVLFPDGDFMWKPEQGQAVARMVPNGEFYLIRNAGHFMQEDAGEEIAGYIIRFIRERV